MRIDLAPDDDVATVVRAARDESVVLVILPGRDSLAQALVEAAIGPLAVEVAPGMRLNAIVVTGNGPAVDSVVTYLDNAASTTGQVLTLS